MGWWNFPNDPSVWVGDEVMDDAYDYLERLAERYGERFGRKPTLAELQAGMRLALRVRGEKMVEDITDERSVESVVIKTIARPKRQKYEVGDIFAVPLPGGRYAFGRILNLSDGWELVEIFAHIAESDRYSNEITEAGRLLPPIVINPRDVFGGWKWKIVDSHPGYVAPDLDSLRYMMGMPGRYQLVSVGDIQPRKALSDAEAKALPRWATLTEEGARTRIEAAAREQQLL